jgi:hypothetical protein
MNNNTIYRYNYIRNKNLDMDELTYQDKGIELLVNTKECDNNPVGFNFWKVRIKGGKCNWIEKISKGREYLGKSLDWYKNYESGKLEVVHTECIQEDKYKIRLTDDFTVTKHKYPEEFEAVVYNYLPGKRLPDYNSKREIHRIKNGIIFSTDYFLEEKMFLSVKNKRYEFHDFQGSHDSDIIFLKEQPKFVEAYEKDKLLYTLTIGYDEYGIVKEIFKNDEKENRAVHKVETNYLGDVSVESTYFLFLDKFDISRNELIDQIIVKEKVTITEENYIYTRELLIPEV